MGKVSKATKKFQSKQLKHTLDHRKKVKDFKLKTKGRRGNKTDAEKRDAQLTKEEQIAAKSKKEDVFKDMSVDAFFEGGFQVPTANKKLAKKSKQDESDASSSEEDNDDEVDMEDLKKQDPDFYKYLEENDKELLDFKSSNPLDNISDDDEDDDDDDEEAEDNQEQAQLEESEKKDEQKIQVTLQLVKKWRDSLHSKPSPKILRSIISAFKAAINMNNEEAVDQYKYAVTDEKAFNQLMFLALKDLPTVITTQMAPYKMKNGSRVLANGAHVSKISSVLQHHAGSLITLLNDITNTETAALVLHSTNQLLPYFISSRRILKQLVLSIVTVWSSTRDVETQIATFAFLTNAAKEYKKSLLELVLKTCYSTFIKSCRQTNIRTMPLLNFQKNSAAELFGIDETLSYQIGFEYIRQLAIHLRNSINVTTGNKRNTKLSAQEAYKIVYNWQFCHSLDFWSRVLSVSCNPEKEQGKESVLRQLIYPLVQVTLGVARLIPTAQFFPLRFYLIRSLLRLSQNTGVYIPIFPILSEILSSTVFTKNPKKVHLESFDFDHNIKCNAAYLNSKVYQDGVGEQFVELVGEFFVLYCKSITFPELSTPAIISLRRYLKTSKNVKLNKQLNTVVEKINSNVDYIMRERSSVDYSPSNKTQAMKFLEDVDWKKTPLGHYVSVQRDVKEEKARMLRESLESESEADQQEEEEEDDEDVEMSETSEPSSDEEEE
ncbi:Nucleolar Complex 2 protein [Hanseniaspora vineae]